MIDERDELSDLRNRCLELEHQVARLASVAERCEQHLMRCATDLMARSGRWSPEMHEAGKRVRSLVGTFGHEGVLRAHDERVKRDALLQVGILPKDL